MAEQFEKTEVMKPENETVTDVAAQKRINHVADEVAEKSSRTEQKYETDHQVFSK